MCTFACGRERNKRSVVRSWQANGFGHLFLAQHRAKVFLGVARVHRLCTIYPQVFNSRVERPLIWLEFSARSATGESLLRVRYDLRSLTALHESPHDGHRPLDLACAAATSADGQSAAPPLYRVFLSDGSALASFGEWARVGDQVVFSMPLKPAAGAGELHLVSLPVQRIDLGQDRAVCRSGACLAIRVRTRGEADFAQLRRRRCADAESGRVDFRSEAAAGDRGTGAPHAGRLAGRPLRLSRGRGSRDSRRARRRHRGAWRAGRAARVRSRRSRRAPSRRRPSRCCRRPITPRSFRA